MAQPMQDLNEIHQRIRETKKEKKQLSNMYRDALTQSKSYQEVVDQIAALKIKKAQIETAIRSEFSSELEKQERLKENLKADTELMSDVALTKFMKGETVEVVDENNVKYEPVIKVAFKKAG